MDSLVETTVSYDEKIGGDVIKDDKPEDEYLAHYLNVEVHEDNIETGGTFTYTYFSLC